MHRFPEFAGAYWGKQFVLDFHSNNALKKLKIYVATTQDYTRRFILHTAAFTQEASKRGSTRAFGNIVRIDIVGPNCGSNFCFG